MADIIDINEAWAGHSGLEVETFLKNQMTYILAASQGKFGAATFDPQTMVITFWDQPGGTPLGTISLGGSIYTIALNCNLPQIFYILADEGTKIMQIAPTTSKSSWGSADSEPFPEGYTYAVAVNNGAGYIPCVEGHIDAGGSASFDIKPFLTPGSNYVRVAVTGDTSGQTQTTVFTATLTTLSLSCNHTWQNVWTQGQNYVINGIRFAGNLWKTLEVSLDDVPLEPVEYSPSQSYTTTSTYYTIPASAFPSGGSGVHSVKLKMTAQGVSTPEISFNIMCAAEGDARPLVAINAIAARAYNFTNGTLFSFAVYNANKVAIDLSATLNSILYPIVSGHEELGLESGFQYPFAYDLEVDTGANNEKIGSLAIAAKAYYDNTEGNTATASTLFDNTYSYLATPGYLFYLNASTRSNNASDYQAIVNEAGASEDFPASYPAVWSGMSWYNDGWANDPLGYKALCIPAGCSLTVPTLAPLELLTHEGYDGMTVEFMIQGGSPSEYGEPLLKIATGGANPNGILIYPTKVTVLTNGERDVDSQSVNFSENAMTHICITILRKYEQREGKNLCSVYVNGISNACFSFTNASDFGDGALTIGQEHTDVYLYKMRVYGAALESGAVLNNFLNCIVDGVEFNRGQISEKNNILYGNDINYDMVKAAGFNTMVVTTPIDPQTHLNYPIPSFFGIKSVNGCTVRFEYAGTPMKNVTVSDVDMDGQGTTSKQYFRWNLRWKTKGTTTWTYGDGTTGTPGKVGKMINDTTHIAVDRITAKKNIASMPQGHKMGMTGLYNDLFHQIGLGDELPHPQSGPDYIVAVYQFPFIGFRYNSVNNFYEFIGMYTVGPDKGSKESFGYLKGKYPNCLSIEGPNHAPRGTRFLIPWVDVTYNPREETLCFEGEEGWDCDYVKYETGYGDDGEEYPEDWAAIRQLYETEWRPAYDCVYDNSPYIASHLEVINQLQNPSVESLSDLLNPNKARLVVGAYTNGMAVTNQFIAIYDGSYDLYYYSALSGAFVKLPNDYPNNNALTGLASYLSALGYSTTNPTTEQIIKARGARFKATMSDYFSESQTLFHYEFCLLYGVTDNFAKNSYPFKFYKFSDTLPAGANINQKRWGWRQDDLDTVLMTDNTGTNTKKYSVEHGDLFNNSQVFQGGDSAFWVLIRDNYQSECADMMARIATAATSLATSLGIGGNGQHESLFNLTSYYCWEHSAKYFPATVYEGDRVWSYIEPWLLAGQTIPGTSETYPQTYNGVAPLKQAIGDQYQGERLWMERRIAYMFSKYKVAAFTGDNAGFGRLEFTLAQGHPFEFHLTPAIDLYPVVSTGSTDRQGGRTQAGEESEIAVLSPDGMTTSYLHGLSWMADLGDLAGMMLTTRGTSTAIDFLVSAARLQKLKVGDEDPTKLEDGFNATNFSVTSPTLVELDAQNTTTVTNIVNLLGCPRLRKCEFAGSNAAGLYLPIGAKLTEVSFPDNAQAVLMHSLPFLENSGITWPDLSHLSRLYINNCAMLNPLAIAEAIFATTGQQLAYATLIWAGIIAGSYNTIMALTAIAGEVVFDGRDISPKAGKAHVEGTMMMGGIYADQFSNLDIVSEEPYQTNLRKALSNLFGTNLYIIYDPDNIYIRFASPELGVFCATQWGDGVGITTSQAAAVSSSQFSTAFRNWSGKSTVASFNEFVYFTGVTAISQGSSTSSNGGALNGWTSLQSITTPSSLVSIGSYNLTSTPIKTWRLNNRLSFGGNQNWRSSTQLLHVYIKNLSHWANTNKSSEYGSYKASSGVTHLYYNDVLMTEFDIPNTDTTIYTCAFLGCTDLTKITVPSSITSIPAWAFYRCTSLLSIVFRSEIPPTLSNTNAFSSNASGRKIYVPYSSDHSILAAYKAATNWSTYASSIYELDENGNIPA